jgi:hypothetical protein
MTHAGAQWACIDDVVADYRIRAGGMHHHAAGMGENRRAILDRVFSWPDLPAEVRALRPLAYQNALLEAAADHFQAGDLDAGAAWFRAAAEARPELTCELWTLESFARFLLPLGYQTGTLMAAEWHWIAKSLARALSAALASPSLGGRRWSAWRTYGRLVLRLIARAARARLDPRRRRRTATQIRQLREFVARPATIPAPLCLPHPAGTNG